MKKKKSVCGMLSVCLITAALAAPLAEARGPKAQAEALNLKVGDVAPDFKLQYFNGSDLKDITLSQYRGKKNVVVAFYIFAFTGG